MNKGANGGEDRLGGRAEAGRAAPGPAIPAPDPDRVRVAATRRRRRRWREELVAEDLTVVAALLGSWADGGAVTISTVSGTTVHGALVEVGADVAVVAAGSRRLWCALGAIEVVEAAQARPGDRRDRTELTLDTALAELVGGPELTITTRGGTVVRGALVSSGDVLVMRAEHPRREVVVAARSVCWIDAPEHG